MSRIVHVGLGNFFRAHACWWTGAVEIADREAWTVSAFTGRRPDTAAALSAQNCRYTLIERGPEEDSFELITALTEACDGADLETFTHRIADPQTAIVTLTITENGYCLDPDGCLDPDHPAVVHDRAELRHPDPKPVTAAGRLARALEIRRLADSGPIAVVPLDNVAANGDALRRGLLDLVSPALADWITTEASFVNTSVDRITPRAADIDRALVWAATGFDDRSPVVTEPFRYWVLAGDFPAGRPSWDRLDARFVDDIAPWERRKLWLLNGAHSLLAYRGLTVGLTTVAEAIAALDADVEIWWDEVETLLDTPDNDAYRRALRERFANPRIAHRLEQIAEDGIAKLRVRAAEPALLLRRSGRDASAAAATIAAWIDFCATDAGRRPGIAPALPPDAPSADYLAALSPALADDRDFVRAVTERRTGSRR
jgi:fructuronate reductase